MLLAIDIGNTTISLGIMKGEEAVQVLHLETALGNVALRRKLCAVLLKWQKKYQPISEIIICSVVPKTLKTIKPFLKMIFGKAPLVIGKDIKVPIKNLYKNPRQVGQDRLVGAYAAKIQYGFPCVVVDLGTAITFDIVSKKGEYLGGLILPGLRMSVESLFKKTALLPKVKIQKPKELIGRDTKNSILGGIFYGYGTLCDGLIQLISKELKVRPKVIVTGGHTFLMKEFSREISTVDRHLVFKGIALAYQYSKRPPPPSRR